jgi:1-acyl-sn-glycerol-3-phosphate acyltransferase
MAKYITIDRGNKESRAEMLAQSAKSLRDGISIMIFPEGTRSPDNQIGPFKMGAFELALITDKPIIPVVIEGTWDVLPKHGLSVSGGHKISVKVLDPVYPGYFGTADPAQLAAKFRMIISDELIKIRGGLQ